MKKGLAGLFSAFLLIAFTAFTVRIVSIFEQLNIAEQEAKEYILSDLTNGTLNFPYSEILKKLAVNKRTEAVEEIGTYIRKYTESPEFEKEFKAARDRMVNGNRPAKKTKDQLLQEKVLSLKEDIKTSEEDMRSAAPDMKKLYELTLQQLRENLAALENPSHPKHKLFVADMMEFYEENYKEQLAMSGADMTNENTFPATSRELVKQRLQQFLNLTADIDWDAKLVASGNVKKFADPKLEAKSTEWKRCFRAGKETIMAARAYAQKWLASIKG